MNITRLNIVIFIVLLSGCESKIEKESASTKATKRPVSSFSQSIGEKGDNQNGRLSNDIDMPAAIKAAFPRTNDFIYSGNESGCDGLKAHAEIKDFLKITPGVSAIIAVVSFSTSEAPHVCYGFVKITGLKTDRMPYRSIFHYEIPAGDGFGSAPSKLAITRTDKGFPQVKIGSGFTGQGYTSSTIKTYTITSLGVKEGRKISTCSDPEGNVRSGTC